MTPRKRPQNRWQLDTQNDLVSPIFRSTGTICGGLFPKMYRKQICKLESSYKTDKTWKMYFFLLNAAWLNEVRCPNRTSLNLPNWGPWAPCSEALPLPAPSSQPALRSLDIWIPWKDSPACAFLLRWWEEPSVDLPDPLLLEPSSSDPARPWVSLLPMTSFLIPVVCDLAIFPSLPALLLSVPSGTEEKLADWLPLLTAFSSLTSASRDIPQGSVFWQLAPTRDGYCPFTCQNLRPLQHQLLNRSFWCSVSVGFIVYFQTPKTRQGLYAWKKLYV